MIVLSQKKIVKVVASIFLIILIFVATVNIRNEKDNYVSTVTLPVSGKVVVIDARTWSA